MKTSQEIYMNFRATQTVVEELRGIARDTRRVSDQDIDDALRQVRGSWQGNNADTFLAKGTRLQQNIKETARVIDELAGTLEQIARNTYKAEMEAIQTSQQR